MTKEQIPAFTYTLQGVKDSLEDRSYLTAVIDDENRETIIVNIIEKFYQPQQRKLNKVLELIGEKPVVSLYFTNTGEALLETSQLKEGEFAYATISEHESCECTH